MPKATCLANDKRKEFCVLNTYSADAISSLLELLEIYCGWDLINDYISIRFVGTFETYKNVSSEVRQSDGGEIINEYISFH